MWREFPGLFVVVKGSSIITVAVEFVTRVVDPRRGRTAGYKQEYRGNCK